MSTHEPSDPLNEYDISDIIKREENDPETLVAIKKYTEFSTARAKILKRLKAAKEDAEGLKGILASNKNLPLDTVKKLETGLCGLENEVSDLEAKANNTTKAVIQAAVEVRAAAENGANARALAFLERAMKAKADRDATDDGSVVESISSNQSTYTLRSGRGEFSVKAGSVPNGKGEGGTRARYDGRPTPSKATKEDEATPSKAPANAIPSPPSGSDGTGSFFDDDDEVPPLLSGGNPTAGAGAGAGAGGVPEPTSPGNVDNLDLARLGIGSTNAQGGANGDAPPPAANANGAAIDAYELSGHTGNTGNYPSLVGGGSAQGVPEDETLTQTEGGFTVEVCFLLRSFYDLELMFSMLTDSFLLS